MSTNLAHRINLEATVLGALLLDKAAPAAVSDQLAPASFLKDEHQLIYRAIGNLVERSEPVDVLTVGFELGHLGALAAAGGESYLLHLAQQAMATTDVQVQGSRLLLTAKS